MVKNLEEALAKYKKELRKYKRLYDKFFANSPENCQTIFLPAEDYWVFAKLTLKLQGMAFALGLSKREARAILKEVGAKEITPMIDIQK